MLHWRTWQAIPDVDLVAAVDTDVRKVLWNNREAVVIHRRCEDLIGHIDAAIVATPSEQHLASSLPLLNAGIHCLIEKPLALTVADSTRLITAAAMHQARLAVGHSERFNPAIQRARDFLSGNVRAIEVFRMATPGAGAEADVVHDLMVHDLDWLICALSRLPDSVRILDACHAGGSLSRVSCELTFANGLTVQVTSSRIEGKRRRELVLHLNSGETRHINLDSESFQAGKDPLTLQAHAFLDLLRGRTSAIATGVEILQVMTLSEQIRADCMLTENSDAGDAR